MRLIDADALKASIEEKDRYNLGGEHRIVVCGMLDDAPTIDTEPVKHGRWIKTSSPYHFKCSSCGVIANIKFHSVEDHKFCWYCGAKMDLKDGESE